MAELYRVNLGEPPSDYPAPDYDLSDQEHEWDAGVRVYYSHEWWSDPGFPKLTRTEDIDDYEGRLYALRYRTSPSYRDDVLDGLGEEDGGR